MHAKAPHPLARVKSLLRTGPWALCLRFADQSWRLLTGAPLWRLSRVTPRLYVGGQHYPRGYGRMLDHGITAVVNLRETHHSDVQKGIAFERHLHLATPDNTPPSMQALLRGAAFAHDAMARGSVYVHCGIGVGRAPTLAAAILIADGLTPDEAMNQIKRVRPFVHLTPGQRLALDDFADAWHSQN